MPTSSVEVVTPAASYRLADLATVRVHVAEASGLSDDVLGTMLDAVSAAIARVCRRVLPAERVRETITPDAGRTIGRWALDRRPVATVYSVTCAEDGVAVPSASWAIEHRQAETMRLDVAETVVIEYTGGYSVIPADLVMLAIEAVRDTVAARSRVPGLLREELDGYSYELGRDVALAGPGLSPGVLAALDTFKRVELA